MNKKLLSFLLMLTMIMFIGIDVKAGCSVMSGRYPGCTSSCSHTKEPDCSNDKYGTYPCCRWTDPTCTDDKELVNHSCVCPKISLTVTDGCTGSYSPNGESCSISGSATNATKMEYSSSNTKYVTVDKEKGTLNVVGSPTSGKTCKAEVTITVKASSLCDTTGKSDTGNITVMTPWGGGNAGRCYKVNGNYGHCIGKKAAEAADKAKAYEGCGNDTGKGYLECAQVYSRGCGKKEPTPACYRDGNGLLRWGTYTTINDDGDEVMKSGYHGYKLVSSITKEEDCYTQFGCSTKYPDPRNVETTCNGTHEPTGEPGKDSSQLSGVYLKKCGAKYGSSIGSTDENGNDVGLFYKITCKETMRTAFNGPIFDNESSFMYPGTGFGFNYFAKTKIDCEGKWNSSFYSIVEEYIKGYISSRIFNSTTFHNEDSGFFNSALDGLTNVSNSYKNWKPNYFGLGKPSATIKDIQPDGKVQKKDWHLFNLVFEELATEGSSSCGDLPNGSLKNFTYQELHNIKMKLPILRYDKNAKYVSETDNQYKVSECTSSDPDCLGRIFPVSDSKEFAGSDYKYEVVTSGLGMSHNWTNRETCNITMKTKEVFFRQINLSDPFVQKLNPDRGIGLNWKNSKFNFVNLIDPNIWNKASEYNMIRITEEDGKNIKTELNTNKGYYTGICSSGSAAAASTICAKYNQAVSGK